MATFLQALNTFKALSGSHDIYNLSQVYYYTEEYPPLGELITVTGRVLEFPWSVSVLQYSLLVA